MLYNPFRNILLVMSLSGSVILLSYILIYPISKRYFSLAFRYGILKIVLAFYLIPFPLFAGRIRDIVFETFPELIDSFGARLDYLDTEYAVFTEGSSVYYSPGVQKMLVLLAGLGVLSFALILWYAFRYYKTRKICIGHSDIQVKEKEQELFYAKKDKLNIKRKVKFLCSEYCKSPMTMGVISPVVIIPLWGKEIDSGLYQDALIHELVHIKHCDMLIKFLGLAAIAVHWFNPLVYLLYKEISNISEMYCDSVVLEGKGEKERKAYGELLLKLAAEAPSGDNRFVAGITGNSKRDFKRRIMEMKADRKNKTLISVFAMILICIAGGMTIFAYETPQTISFPDDMGGMSREQEIRFYVQGELEIGTEELPYDYFFTDESGNIYNLDGGEYNTQASCSHKYVLGNTTSHHKNSSGGCTIKSLEAWRCSKCGNVKIGEEISSTTYKKCPH